MTPPDILLIICDTTRSDALDPWNERARTPNIARLCREGRRYARAVSAAPWTLPATASMLSGALPTEHGISGDRLNRDGGSPGSPRRLVLEHEGPWLVDRLRDRGYETWAVSCNPWVSPWGGFDRGFDRFFAVSSRRRIPANQVASVLKRAAYVLAPPDQGGRTAVRLCRRALADGGSGPRFGLVNLMEAHSHYFPPMRFHPMWNREGGPARSWRLPVDEIFQRGRLRVKEDERFRRSVRSLYYACARFQDELVGSIVAAAAGGGRRLVVVLVSDHGEHLGEQGLYAHNSSLEEELLAVPLVVWGQRPAVDPEVVEDRVSLLGLRAAIEEVADGGDGRLSPDGVVQSEYESTLLHMGSIPAYLRRRMDALGPDSLPPLVQRPGLAVYEGSTKYVATDGAEESLFVLDDGDVREVASSDGADTGRVARELWLKRRERLRGTSGDKDVQRVEAGMAEHLRTLGYIE